MRLLSIIVAVSENGVIGKDGGTPWHLPDDLGNFKRQTMGKPIVMGRKTHQSIGRRLDGRRNVVLSRDPDFVPLAGCDYYTDLTSALQGMDDAPEVMVIGGGELYAEALPIADRVYLTTVHLRVEGGDTFFPPKLDEHEWVKYYGFSSIGQSIQYDFEVFERRRTYRDRMAP